jgi:tetratricopeptide (TPR) repeat protein
MPLGLELAASWVDMLSMKDIASEIKRSIDFLETEMRNIPTRHRSIRAVFDSSWEYLSENEKEIFPKFSVFRGGFNRDAAQEVTGATIRVLAKFVHKSLIQYNQDEDCYQIHELLRQYGQEHLDKSIHKLEQTKSHHSRYYCKIVRDQTSSLMTGDYTSYEKIEAKLPNIQVGLLWAIAQGDLMNIDQAIDGICMFYDWHWRVEDARSITDSTREMLIKLLNQSHTQSDLSNQENTIKRILAKVLSWQGYFNLYHDYKSALNTLNESLSIVNSLISTGVEAHIEKTHILFFLGITNYLSGELNSAKVCFQESLALSQEIKNEFMVLNNLFSLGDTARTLGTPREAKTWYEKSLKEARRTKSLWGEITALRGLGWASRRLMDFDGAKQIFGESLSLSISNNKPIDQIRALESLGYLTLYQGKFSKAIEYFSNAISISTDLGIPNRTYSCQVHIGVSYWLQGKLIEAEPYIASGLKIIPDNDPGWTEFFLRVFYAEYLTMVGRYTEAKEQISLANAKFGKHGLDRFISGRATRTLGWIAIAEKDYIEAVRQFEASIKLFKIDTDDEQIAWSQAGLALGRMGEGKWEAAKDSLIDALWTTFEIKAFIPLLFTLPMTLLILSKDNPALAGQVYAQIQTSPFLANAPFFKDTIYDFLPANIFSKPGIPSEGEIDFNNSLWLTASKVLSGWIQVWMDDPAPRMIPSTKGK